MRVIQFSFIGMLCALAGCSTEPKLWGPKPSNFNPLFAVYGENSSERNSYATKICEQLDSKFVAVASLRIIPIDPDAEASQAFVCDLRPQEKITPLQLRLIQSRRFSVGVADLQRALTTYHEDMSGHCISQDQDKGLGSDDNVYKLYCKTPPYMHRYEITSVGEKGSVLRARIIKSMNHSLSEDVQLTETEPYTEFFLRLSGQIFVDAIELNPEEIL